MELTVSDLDHRFFQDLDALYLIVAKASMAPPSTEKQLSVYLYIPNIIGELTPDLLISHGLPVLLH